MLNEWIRNLPVDFLRDIVLNARPGTILVLATHELNRRQATLSSAA
ncbi:hypothetical protein GALL_155120 [mine drainage metagenome]|uniref:Uncharacterized protein n=1 Tax=mine drainage metagenome TaxID=410659 RepID=A0A1J5S2W7_9ZZZZ